MNSAEEKQLFEKYGWVYDYVQREWRSPDDTVVTQDTLMKYTSTPKEEFGLMLFIRQHGKEK